MGEVFRCEFRRRQGRRPAGPLSTQLHECGINLSNALFIEQVLDDLDEPGMRSEDIAAAIGLAKYNAYEAGWNESKAGCCGCLYNPDVLEGAS